MKSESPAGLRRNSQHLTRRELCELAARINTPLPSFPEGSAERATTLANLPNIRAVLARAAPKPG